IRDFHVTGVQTCALPIFPGLPQDILVLPHGSGQSRLGSRQRLSRKINDTTEQIMRRRLRKHRHLPNARLNCLQETTQRGLVQLAETRLRIRRDQKTATRRNHHRLYLRPSVRAQNWLPVLVSLKLRSHASDGADLETAVGLRNKQTKTRLVNAVLNRNHPRLYLRPSVRAQNWLPVLVSLKLRSHASDGADLETAVGLRNKQIKNRLVNAVLNRNQRPHHAGSPPLQINILRKPNQRTN